MRLLHLYGGNLYGGVERMLVSLAVHAPLCPELEPTFALCFPGRLERELRAAGAALHALGAVRVSRPWQVRRARRRLGAYLAGHAFDVAVCHAWWTYAIFGPALRRAGLPVVLWAHDTATGRGWLEAWARRSPPDLLLTHSRFMAASLAAMFPLHPALVLYAPVENPSDCALSSVVRRQLDTPADCVVILQASRLEPWKGQRLLLHSLARLRDRADWVCWIAGGAQRPKERRYLRQLQSLARQLGLEARLRWLGERSDVAALMGAADIFCQPNPSPEPFGIVFVEALAAGLPVVATALGGPLEIVTPDCGLLPSPDAASVAAALRSMIADPAERARRCSGSRARARLLGDPGAHLRRFADLIRPLAAA